MRELQFQSLVIKAVREAGGFGFKLANKFLAGIPDLLLQIPNYSTTLWEVKLFGKGPTQLQANCLSEYIAAGGKGGMIYFDNIDGLRIGVQTWEFRELYIQMISLKRGHREETILEALRAALSL